VRRRGCFFFWFVLLAAGMAMGCKKQGAGPDASAGTNALAADQPGSEAAAPPSPRGPGPMPVASAPGVIQDQADPNAVLAQLSLELRKYVVRTRSVPKNYEEFIAKSQVQAPPPPAGKKYAIQNKAVVLVNR
jgi:hypothetical protein